MYIGLRLDYRLRLWAPSASRTITAVAELLVGELVNCLAKHSLPETSLEKP